MNSTRGWQTIQEAYSFALCAISFLAFIKRGLLRPLCYEDLDAFVMAVSCIDGQCFVSFIRGKTQIGSVSFDLEHMAVNDIVTCIGTYVDPILKQHEIDKSSFYKVFEDLKSVQTLSEKQALQLLKENGQIDKFIF